MIDGADWESLVPDPAADVIKECDGVRRIQQVTSSDGATHTGR